MRDDFEHDRQQYRNDLMAAENQHLERAIHFYQWRDRLRSTVHQLNAFGIIFLLCSGLLDKWAALFWTTSLGLLVVLSTVGLILVARWGQRRCDALAQTQEKLADQFQKARLDV